LKKEIRNLKAADKDESFGDPMYKHLLVKDVSMSSHNIKYRFEYLGDKQMPAGAMTVGEGETDDEAD
jgi:hypothetical protein